MRRHTMELAEHGMEECNGGIGYLELGRICLVLAQRVW